MSAAALDMFNNSSALSALAGLNGSQAPPSPPSAAHIPKYGGSIAAGLAGGAGGAAQPDMQQQMAIMMANMQAQLTAANAAAATANAQRNAAMAQLKAASNPPTPHHRPAAAAAAAAAAPVISMSDFDGLTASAAYTPAYAPVAAAGAGAGAASVMYDAKQVDAKIAAAVRAAMGQPIAQQFTGKAFTQIRDEGAKAKKNQKVVKSMQMAPDTLKNFLKSRGEALYKCCGVTAKGGRCTSAGGYIIDGIAAIHQGDTLPALVCLTHLNMYIDNPSKAELWKNKLDEDDVDYTTNSALIDQSRLIGTTLSQPANYLRATQNVSSPEDTLAHIMSQMSVGDKTKGAVRGASVSRSASNAKQKEQCRAITASTNKQCSFGAKGNGFCGKHGGSD